MGACEAFEHRHRAPHRGARAARVHGEVFQSRLGAGAGQLVQNHVQVLRPGVAHGDVAGVLWVVLFFGGTTLVTMLAVVLSATAGLRLICTW